MCSIQQSRGWAVPGRKTDVSLPSGVVSAAAILPSGRWWGGWSRRRSGGRPPGPAGAAAMPSAPQSSCEAIAHIGDSHLGRDEPADPHPRREARLEARTRPSAPPTSASTSPAPARWSSASRATRTVSTRPAACARGVRGCWVVALAPTTRPTSTPARVRLQRADRPDDGGHRRRPRAVGRRQDAERTGHYASEHMRRFNTRSPRPTPATRRCGCSTGPRWRRRVVRRRRDPLHPRRLRLPSPRYRAAAVADAFPADDRDGALGG